MAILIQYGRLYEGEQITDHPKLFVWVFNMKLQEFHNIKKEKKNSTAAHQGEIESGMPLYSQSITSSNL